jgi:very-short-patch-repair endonuclease
MSITQDLIDRNRRELLDLSTRNRLLSIPVGSKSARVIHIYDELTLEIFRVLVEEKKAMSFLPSKKSAAEGSPKKNGDKAAQEDDADEVELPQPDEDVEVSKGLAKRHTDVRLQTALSSEGLQSRLLSLYRDAQTMIEEQGVNVLYLALGQLKWFEADNLEIPRFAPLILVPVELVRAGASDRFKLIVREEDVQANLSLEAKMKADFGISLPLFPEADDLDPKVYLGAVTKAVAANLKWEVLPNAMTLGFFSFAKFLMYRDLDSENWPEPSRLLAQPLITRLMVDGFPSEESPFKDDVHIDEVIPADKLDHVVDADATQTLAIELVRRGKNLVVQGPPGTGKSQSITNIISTAVLDGKRVLFVAEKLAALEVVKRRLEREGLGALCLELHSEKAQKRAVLQEIARTWKLGRPVQPAELETTVQRLDGHRKRLNGHAAALHRALAPSGLAPFTLIGRLSALGESVSGVSDLSYAGAEKWNAESLRECRSLVAELCERIGQIGLPNLHPWRGVRRESVLKIDFERIIGRIRATSASLSNAVETATALATVFKQPAPETLERIEALCRMGKHAAAAPTFDRQALCDGVWAAGVEGMREVLAHGLAFAQANAEVGAKVIPDAWSMDFRAERLAISAHGDSLLRFLNGEYRRSIAKVKGVLTIPVPKANAERLALVDRLIAGQRAKYAIVASDVSSRAAFGSVWKAENTDWLKVSSILDWMAAFGRAGLDDSFRRTFASIDDPAEAGRLAEKLTAGLAAAESAMAALISELVLDVESAFGVKDHRQFATLTLLERLGVWLQRMDDLPRWTTYFARSERASGLGLNSLLVRLERGQVPITGGVEAFDYVYFCQLYREAMRLSPELAEFDGDLHTRYVEEFRQLDRDRLALAKYRVLAAHHTRLPPSTGAMGATGVLKGEMERKRGHRSVRKLLKDAGSVVQAIKPVFMMSPLSVAQFLEPGAVDFDLLVIDEASQVQPVDALGAVARCKQIIVVGDSRQLPPTRFFNRITSDAVETDELDEAQAAGAKDVESILGLCRARGVPERMLRWHYRSRHQSLIAVSNQEFYENQLFIVPSPWSAAAGLGLKFNHVPGGVFDRGGTSTNAVEALTVARAVIRHAREDGKHSLGVAAFGLKQQQAILDELELLRRENPDTELFFNSRGAEPFFVKNLENVQGDERDVIFISVGYARDRSGNMMMAFGPLGADGGERRLNVLISRAKRRCEVFSSITAEDIDLNRAKGRGVHALKSFLAFAQTGRLATAAAPGREENAILSEAVKRSVESLGHEVHIQVGLAGFFVDLAVVDRENNGRYVLGIECDGTSYHSSRSARDRDRLRQSVLQDHGWILHRVWSADWFQQPAEQLRRIATAIEKAKAELAEIAREEKRPEVTVQVSVETETPDGIEREVVLNFESESVTSTAEPYSEARFEVPREIEPHILSSKGMAEILLKIVQHEGPIHEEELVTRVRELWGLQRAGTRIQDAVARAVRSLLITKRCVREDSCLAVPGAPVRVRNRAAAQSAGLRKPELLPGVEIRAAIIALLNLHHGATKAEIPAEVARQFGFKSTGATLRSIFDYQIKRMIKLGLVDENDGMLRVVGATKPT